MSDRLVLLGSKGGPALRPGGPWPSSSLLELGGRTIVVDCGLGVTRGLVDAGISLKALDLVFITHLHSD
ncbi:MAG: MBL fold metallo-hydrolase, partial [Mesorhizobium sp.]